ncbi:MAG: hypothetical protein NC099_05610 [Corallococcus sp.]|nr:hypothetical protein [Bacillota bacterium]MCM1534110.1 hypothetical protein [Corallococcus sp.]
MKKVIVIALAIIMALSVVALVSCSGKTYSGEYSYENPYAKGSYYGAKVQVTIQGNVITKVVLLSDEESGWTNLSSGWTNDPYKYNEYGVDADGKTNWRLHHQEMLDSFVGLTVDEILAMKVVISKSGEPLTSDPNVETIKYAPEQLVLIVRGHGDYTTGTGATQSSGRVICAVQNAVKVACGMADTAPNTIELETDSEGLVVPSTSW